MCNIWVILRRNVMYLYNKKPHLDQLFHCQRIQPDSKNPVEPWQYYPVLCPVGFNSSSRDLSESLGVLISDFSVFLFSFTRWGILLTLGLLFWNKAKQDTHQYILCNGQISNRPNQGRIYRGGAWSNPPSDV
jgi:hypothetical protein